MKKIVELNKRESLWQCQKCKTIILVETAYYMISRPECKNCRR
jgi:hypothetical protein